MNCRREFRLHHPLEAYLTKAPEVASMKVFAAYLQLDTK